MTDELQRKVDRAVKLIQAAGKVAKEHGQPLEICYSGGKDSDVILELARMSGVDIRPIYKNTTIDPPGTIKHAIENGVEMARPKMTFKQIIEKRGIPGRLRRFCCEVLKEYKISDYAVVGVRRDESTARAERYHEPEQCRVYNNKEKARLYYPLLDFTAKETGFAVVLMLSTKFDYTSAVLNDWRKRLEADDYIISVKRNQLRVRFNIMYGKK